MQNCFKCTPVHVENHASKIAGMHITDINMIH